MSLLPPHTDEFTVEPWRWVTDRHDRANIRLAGHIVATITRTTAANSVQPVGYARVEPVGYFDRKEWAQLVKRSGADLTCIVWREIILRDDSCTERFIAALTNSDSFSIISTD